MPDTWTRIPDLGKVLEDYLNPLYTTYRNALGNPSDIPDITEIEWGSWYSGSMPHTFRCWEEYIDVANRYLGGARNDIAIVSLWFVTRWFEPGRPPYLSEWRHFINQTMSNAATPLDTALSSQGIKGLFVNRFRIGQGPQEARQVSSTITELAGPLDDFWTLQTTVNVMLFEHRI